MAFATESIATWRERVLSPWKFNRIFFTDAELDAQIDRVFRCDKSVGAVKRVMAMLCFMRRVLGELTAWLTKGLS